jgi:hypothetical protein
VFFVSFVQGIFSSASKKINRLYWNSPCSIIQIKTSGRRQKSFLFHLELNRRMRYVPNPDSMIYPIVVNHGRPRMRRWPRKIFSTRRSHFMRSGLKAVRCSKVWRACYILCTLLVSLYILFDVLDLDGSNLPRVNSPVREFVVAVEVTSDMEFVHTSDQAAPWENSTLVTDESPQEHARFEIFEIPRSSPLDVARSHRYRASLPRDSITD